MKQYVNLCVKVVWCLFCFWDVIKVVLCFNVMRPESKSKACETFQDHVTGPQIAEYALSAIPRTILRRKITLLKISIA